MAILTAFLAADEIAEQQDDLHIVTTHEGDGWFYGFESAEGNESPLTGPYAEREHALAAARALLADPAYD